MKVLKTKTSIMFGSRRAEGSLLYDLQRQRITNFKNACSGRAWPALRPAKEGNVL
jgi:hypothetical protein